MKMRSVILAGGLGERLRPYTAALPKPLMPVGEFPILEILVRQLAKNGVNHITLAVNHQAELFRAYFGNGERWNLKIDYSLETERLGTIAPLLLIPDLPDDFLIMNGDVLTDLRFASLMDDHLNGNSIFTISGYKRENMVDFGVLETNNNSNLVGFVEKPTNCYKVSMGIYAASRGILDFIPPGKPYGFDNLMLELIEKDKPVTVREHTGLWLDIGRSEDYFQANELWEDIKDDI